MYQSFTGSGRRPRQVNLSGKKANPFGASNAGGAQQAIASAHQERAERQHQRERVRASTRIQKTWRGHTARRKTFRLWREIWDRQEEAENGAYPTEEASLRQFRRLMLFFNPRGEHKDVERLIWYGTRQHSTTVTFENGSPWPAAYAQLQRASIASLKVLNSADTDKALLCILAYAAPHVKFSARDAIEYYKALTSTPGKSLPPRPLQSALIAPLKTSRTAYAGLTVLLAKPLDPEMLNLLKAAVDIDGLSQAMLDLGEQTGLNVRARLWLLGNLIALTGLSKNIACTTVVAQLLGSLADDVDFESPAIQVENSAFDREITHATTGLPLNVFLHRQMSSLVDQHSIRNLLVGQQALRAGDYAQVLAGYALTLLRCFPRRADDIRMWLYRGPASSNGVPATQYLWEASKDTNVFTNISASSRNVLSLLKTTNPPTRLKDDWTIILVFMELYTFILKIMDDEEFMGAATSSRQKNPVPIVDVAMLVTFLKNLGFTLYFNAAELNGTDSTTSEIMRPSIGHHFGSHTPSGQISRIENKPTTVAELPGLTIDYMKGLVTGLLRAIYERDSRRSFLPVGHWLMTDRFDMQAFIPGVVAEEESRHMVQEQDEQDEDDSMDEDDWSTLSRLNSSAYVGSGHARALRTQEARARVQRKASRKRYLESVTPRLEILQNMPFLIPFHTRVQIFRQFVTLDQEKRRNGFVDPDHWRQSVMMQSGMEGTDLVRKHHATIQRQQEFSDAYKQFYDLGVALKEPIQISFVDAFGMAEAGIDGGGVTKEFLTSVIVQAFDQSSDAEDKFFIENEKHLLYPNPVAMEEVQLTARAISRYHGTSSESNITILAQEMRRELLKKYEFLGRIIGKCLYEGILVDVTFAGFFLKKWALTGGTGSASMESGYRASINDLRELDEDLYRGLLALKNAEDAEMFGAVFAVNNTVGHATQQEVVQIDLVENGADIAVTNDNRLRYINYLSTYKLQRQSWRQTNAFLRGLSLIIQPSWLSMFNQSELQTLIGGASIGIDVQDLRRNTQYGGTYVIGDDGLEHPSVRIFWDVMQEMEDQDRQKVLKFVTSTPRGPLLGFNHLNPRFSIRDSGSDENRYPTTSTCVNLLKLPMYRTEKTLKEKLLAAVNSGAGFDLS